MRWAMLLEQCTHALLTLPPGPLNLSFTIMFFKPGLLGQTFKCLCHSDHSLLDTFYSPCTLTKWSLDLHIGVLLCNVKAPLSVCPGMVPFRRLFLCEDSLWVPSQAFVLRLQTTCSSWRQVLLSSLCSSPPMSPPILLGCDAGLSLPRYELPGVTPSR